VLVEGQAQGVAQALWDHVKNGAPLDEGQLKEPRMFSQAQLYDRTTGKRFTMINTHISAFDPVGLAQARELFSEVRKIEGPVVLAGDLNTRTALTSVSPTDAKIRALFGPLTDMGASKSHAPGKRTNIDWVLADGFTAGASRWHRGPKADLLSDHYAEEDVFTYR
jgi:endonuclease/exonuclease/phosphatase family metal-dependent hydrolase